MRGRWVRRLFRTERFDGGASRDYDQVPEQSRHHAELPVVRLLLVPLKCASQAGFDDVHAV